MTIPFAIRSEDSLLTLSCNISTAVRSGNLRYRQQWNSNTYESVDLLQCNLRKSSRSTDAEAVTVPSLVILFLIFTCSILFRAVETGGPLTITLRQQFSHRMYYDIWWIESDLDLTVSTWFAGCCYVFANSPALLLAFPHGRWMASQKQLCEQKDPTEQVFKLGSIRYRRTRLWHYLTGVLSGVCVNAASIAWNCPTNPKKLSGIWNPK